MFKGVYHFLFEGLVRQRLRAFKSFFFLYFTSLRWSMMNLWSHCKKYKLRDFYSFLVILSGYTFSYYFFPQILKDNQTLTAILPHVSVLQRMKISWKTKRKKLFTIFKMRFEKCNICDASLSLMLMCLFGYEFKLQRCKESLSKAMLLSCFV